MKSEESAVILSRFYNTIQSCLRTSVYGLKWSEESVVEDGESGISGQEMKK